MTGSKHGRPQRGTAMSAMAKAVTPNKNIGSKQNQALFLKALKP